MFVDQYPLTENVIYSQQQIQNMDSEKKLEEEEHLLKLVFSPKLLYSFKVKGVQIYNQIVCLPHNMFWVSDDKNLCLTNITGDTLHHLKCTSLLKKKNLGYTVNSEGDLIYAEDGNKISQLSKDMETIPLDLDIYGIQNATISVLCSPLNGDLIVGTYAYNPLNPVACSIFRYKKIGHLAQGSKFDKTGIHLFNVYEKPKCIAENNNGDVVLSCYNSVVVIDSGGQPRFTYTGHRSGSELLPQGICTDSLSHILVCDDLTNKVHTIDKNGQFLTHLLVNPSRFFKPHCLSYDVSSHRIYIGTKSEFGENCIYVYSHLAPKTTLTGKYD